jgi:hypothetical protein
MAATNHTAPAWKSTRTAVGSSTEYAGPTMLPSARRLGPTSSRSQWEAVPRIRVPWYWAQGVAPWASGPTRAGPPSASPRNLRAGHRACSVISRSHASGRASRAHAPRRDPRGSTGHGIALPTIIGHPRWWALRGSRRRWSRTRR